MDEELKQLLLNQSGEHNNSHVTGDIVNKLKLTFQRENGLSEDGAKYVAMSTCPFPDSKPFKIGQPDASVGESVVYHVRQKHQLVKPPNLPAGGKWDCHVAFMPLVCDQDFNGAVFNVDTNEVGSNAPVSVEAENHPKNDSCIQICRVAASDPTFVPESPSAAYHRADLPLLTEAGTRLKLIGGGFKVTNASAPLNRSGTVTAYRNEAETTRTSVYESTGNVARPAILGSTPPKTLEQAEQLQAVTYEAGEGILVPFVLDDVEDQKATMAENKPIILFQHDDGKGTESGWRTTIAPMTMAKSYHTRELPFAAGGAYFAGLDENAVLILDVRYFVEKFPSPADPLLLIASPSPEYDPKAMELVAKLQAEFLPGYPANWNSLGSFARAIGGIAKSIARETKPFYGFGKSVLRSVGPQGQAIVGGLESAERLIGKAKNAQNKVKKLQKRVKVLQRKATSAA
jgi:hypothetical protein